MGSALAMRRAPTKIKLAPQKKYGLLVPKGFERDDGTTVLPTERTAEEMRRIEALERQRVKENKIAELQCAEALRQDPTVYEYDSLYDEIKASSARPNVRDSESGGPGSRRAPKYMGSLKDMAVKRRQFLDVAFVNKIRNESARDKAVYGETDAYITQSYKDHLKKNQQWIEDDARAAAGDQNDPSQLDMTRFYTTLLTRNEAFGATGRPVKKPTAASTTTSTTTATSTTASEQQKRNAAAILADADREEQADVCAALEKEDREREERELREMEEHDRREARKRQQETAKATEEQFQRVQEEKRVAAIKEREELVTKVSRRTSEEGISAAKERYLARKAQLQREQGLYGPTQAPPSTEATPASTPTATNTSAETTHPETQE
ncbi:coiled-coil domain-containing protein 55 [Pelomyxa schiedti]|nr:coiled-coil domain-containing protein 55 [Pelomyxa schiedti]